MPKMKRKSQVTVYIPLPDLPTFQKALDYVGEHNMGSFIYRLAAWKLSDLMNQSKPKKSLVKKILTLSKD
jgi:hypothetical protein